MSSTSSSLSEGGNPTAESKVLHDLINELSALRAELCDSGSHVPPTLHPDFRVSAKNLLHYLALRHRDLRPLQGRLAQLGLSSLGRSEPHVLATIDAVLNTLYRLVGRDEYNIGPTEEAVSFQQGMRALEQNTTKLLGARDAKHNAHIMVTMPTEAAEDYQLIHDLLDNGMHCMRINCAHDDADTWLAMIENLHRAKRALGRSCRIMMDLAGPKLRTGPVSNGPDIVRYRPRRDAYGRVVEPARIWLSDDIKGSPPPVAAAACLQVSADWLERLAVGDIVKFRDTRNAPRRLRVVDVCSGGCWTEGRRTAYLDNAVMLEHHPAREGNTTNTLLSGIPYRPSFLALHVGDRLVLTPDLEPGRPTKFGEDGRILSPAFIGCTLPEILPQVKVGDDIWFDDGKIGGQVENCTDGCLYIRITHARRGGSKLRSDKGINLPSSKLQLPALTEKDCVDLLFVANHADIVALSFANTAEDVRSLIQHLRELGVAHPAIVLKIETVRGFRNLPSMILEAMTAPSCGIMIARGDLAVESGFERLAELQEEILWLCEAAHVPVIWATQVLENLAKLGAPTRAEVTDAAMGHRAECVMLNKGPHIVDTVKVLDNILTRMDGHQSKKQSMLRELKLASDWTQSVS